MFRPLTITAVLNGWIVQCGCQTVVYQERNQLVSDLDAYLRDPDATERRFLKAGVNQAHTCAAQALPGRPPDAMQAARVATAAMTDWQVDQYRVGVNSGCEQTSLSGSR